MPTIPSQLTLNKTNVHRIIGTGTSALETLMTQFRSFHLNSANSAGLPNPPKAGDWVSARFSEDGCWYRARIRSNDRTAKEAEVVYIDYGNSEKIPWAKLRPLKDQFSKEKLKPQAVDAFLSFIQLPTSKDYRIDAIHYITDVVANRKLVANVDYTAPEGTLYVTLYDADDNKTPGATETINGDIVAEGHAMVPTMRKTWERAYPKVLETLTEQQRVNILLTQS